MYVFIGAKMVPITNRIRWVEIVVNSIVASASGNQTTQSMVVESEMADHYDGFDLVGDRNCQIVNDKEPDDASGTSDSEFACLPAQGGGPDAGKLGTWSFLDPRWWFDTACVGQATSQLHPKI